MNYELTRHSADVIARRGIDSAWILRTLLHPSRVEPDRVDPALVHHLRRIDEFGGRTLRVIFDPLPVPVRVVTVYFDRAVKDSP